ncbi:DUF4430 domain-containing protein [Oceanobacillus sp. 1P07AA]|uniref:DUF4430 domain-containing protein n=1 Tax=Oceanobacillus sp. 1P07AA TaxID=3132293 RepID=UPI0039A522FD
MGLLKKWFSYVGVLLLSIGLLLGCSNSTSEENNSNTRVSTNETSQELADDEVRITISIDHGSEHVNEKTISIEEGDILLEVLEENFFIEADDSGFITSIERVESSDEEQTAWMYTVNGEMATVGAGDYELSPGDEVVFDLQSWE